MRFTNRILLFACTAFLLSSQQRGPQPAWAGEARQLLTAGKYDDALAVYQREIARTPDDTALNNSAGVLLDLMGRNEDARKHFARNIELASANAAKVGAYRAMAMSYAFQSDCK